MSEQKDGKERERKTLKMGSWLPFYRRSVRRPAPDRIYFGGDPFDLDRPLDRHRIIDPARGAKKRAEIGWSRVVMLH